MTSLSNQPRALAVTHRTFDRETVFRILAVSGLILFCFSLLWMTKGQIVMAAGQDDAQTLFTSVMRVVYNIVTIVGVFYTAMGIIKFIMSHANEQGPEQHKAIMQMAAGIMMIAIPTIMRGLKLEQYINFNN